MINSAAQENCIAALKAALPAKSWSDDPARIAPHMVEWRGKIEGHCPFMVLPASTAEVADIVKICAAHNTPLVPQGGNTGLVGGQIPMGEILLSLTRMTAVRRINTDENAMIVEAGATLKSVQDAAEGADRKFPLSLASEGSCTIGGNLSTNAGGVHVLKYGTTKDLVFGVEAVLADGSVYNGLTSLRKDNTGYDLSRLFLGAEGTLGIITAASLKLFPRPAQTARAMVGLPGIAAALAFLSRVRSGDRLAMFEIIPRIGLELVTTHIPNTTDPFKAPHNWYALLDWELDAHDNAQTFCESLLAPLMEDGLIADAVIAQSDTQAAQLLALREHMSAAQKHNGVSIKHDITIPLSRMTEFFDTADAVLQRLIPGCRPVGFGHLGDGNIHYNIAQPDGADSGDFIKRWGEIEHHVLNIVDALGGSISAEHGIGTFKKYELSQRADPVDYRMMQQIKSTFDPNNIMNPRVLLDRN